MKNLLKDLLYILLLLILNIMSKILLNFRPYEDLVTRRSGWIIPTMIHFLTLTSTLPGPRFQINHSIDINLLESAPSNPQQLSLTMRTLSGRQNSSEGTRNA